MDFSSVVKADRDLVVSKATNKAELNKGLRNYSGSSASSTAVDAENAKLNAANPDKHTVAQNKLVNKNIWEPETFVSQASIKNSFIEQEENEYLEGLRKEREQIREDEKERRLEEAHNKAKEVISSLNQKQLALRFDTSDDYNDARIINVVDAKSNEVIRQIPSEEFLRISESIRNYEQRLAHDDMVGDPALKAKGVEPTGVNESLRGAVLDAMA